MQNGSQLSGFLGAAFSPIAANQYNQNFQFFEGDYCAGKIERVSARAQRYRVLYVDQWMPAACGPWPGVANGLGFIACLVIATLAILGAFEIPIISDYAV